jgi:hypothetical protein
MVFQTFALLPWLTVQANTEMGEVDDLLPVVHAAEMLGFAAVPTPTSPRAGKALRVQYSFEDVVTIAGRAPARKPATTGAGRPGRATSSRWPPCG